MFFSQLAELIVQLVKTVCVHVCALTPGWHKW